MDGRSLVGTAELVVLGEGSQPPVAILCLSSSFGTRPLVLWLEPIRVKWSIPSVGEIVGAFLWSEAIEHVGAQGLRNVGELICVVGDDGDARLLNVARQVLQVLAKSRSRRRLQRF